MVDAYYWGNVDRISPEAPVPIVSVTKQERRLGGAANVSMNVQALGANPILCSVIGDDDEGTILKQIMLDLGQTDMGIVSSKNRKTTQKTRIIGNNHQMLRIDSEDLHNIDGTEEELLLNKIEEILNTEKIDVIIFEDYDKGCITPKVIEHVVNLAKDRLIPTSVDPKKNNFLNYKNVKLFKPNLKELKEGLKVDFNHKNHSELEATINQLNEILKNDITLITLSELGVYIKDKNNKHHIPAHQRDISDVSGAGDTVISVAALCLALKQSPHTIAEISNLAGGLVCEKVGVVPIDKKQLLLEAIELLAQ